MSWKILAVTFSLAAIKTMSPWLHHHFLSSASFTQ